MTNANLAGQNLNGASLLAATLTGADFTGAYIQGANLTAGYQVGITLPQLYSTASYQQHNLANVVFDDGVFSKANFSNQNLSQSSFFGSQLDGADFSHANLQGANLQRTYLTDASLRSANLQGVNFTYAVLANADLTGAQIQGANFSHDYTGTGITLPQLYSTASYQQHDLAGINFVNNDLRGACLANQNLNGAILEDTRFDNADLHGAILTNAVFGDYSGSILSGANLSGVDSRGADHLNPGGAIVTNLILPDGHINGLNLDANQTLVIHNYHGDPTRNLGPISIFVTQSLTMTSGGTLKLQLDADSWDSLIEFDKNISVELGGTLDLEFASGVDVEKQVGRTFDLFDWTGVSPDGQFMVDSPYIWDLSQLYTKGEVTLTAVPEPSSFHLAIMGLVAITGCVRRLSRKSSAISLSFGRAYN